MRPTFKLMVTILLLISTLPAKGQLSAGDIAFLGYNSDNPDAFVVVSLTTIDEGEVIHFTDNGWQPDNTFRSGEGTINWTCPAGGISAGTVLCFEYDGAWTVNTGVLTGSVTLADDGDQILAYTGAEASPTFIAAIQMNGSGWETGAISANESCLPTGLTDGEMALSIPEVGNAVFTGAITGTREDLLPKMNNPDYWHTSDARRFRVFPGLFPLDVFTVSDGTWNTIGNWKSGQVPDNSYSIMISKETNVTTENTSDIYCKNLIVRADAYLIVSSGQNMTIENDVFTESDSKTLTGGIVVQGELTINGTSYVERFIDDVNWHIIASPVTGQSMGGFVSETNNSVQYSSEYGDYDLAPYDELADVWDPYTGSASSSTFASMKGYVMRRTTGGIVQFSGNLMFSDSTIAVSRENYGWNSVGNPYPSPIQGTGSGSFLSANSSQLDPDFAALYIWDKTDYTTFTNSSSQKIALGQGFIVRAKTGGGNIQFTKTMSNNNYATFKSASEEWPVIRLIAQSSEFTNFTEITFNNNMTEGIDPTFDAGKLKGNPDFSVYTRVPDNSSPDLAVQALPIPAGSYRIPVGLDFAGGEVTFSMEYLNGPVSFPVQLEDTERDSIVTFSGELTAYETTTGAESKGTGRFYLLINNSITKIQELEKAEIKTRIEKDNVRITGLPPVNTRISVYSTDGKCLYNFNSNRQTDYLIPTTLIPSGVYILHFSAQNFSETSKITIHPN